MTYYTSVSGQGCHESKAYVVKKKKNFKRNMINLETGGWNVRVNVSFKTY